MWDGWYFGAGRKNSSNLFLLFSQTLIFQQDENDCLYDDTRGPSLLLILDKYFKKDNDRNKMIIIKD